MVRPADPAPQLKPFVRKYVQLEFSTPDAAVIWKIPARSIPGIEFTFGDPYRIRHIDGSLLEITRPAMLIGAKTCQRIQLELKGHVETFTVIFQPTGFRGVLSDLLSERGFRNAPSLVAFPPAWSCVLGLDNILRLSDCTCGGWPNQRSSPHRLDWSCVRSQHHCLRHITDYSCRSHRLSRQNPPNVCPSNQWNHRRGSLRPLLRSGASAATPASTTQEIDGACDVVRDHTGDWQAAYTGGLDWLDHFCRLARGPDLRWRVCPTHILHERALRSADQYLHSTAVRHRRKSNLAEIYRVALTLKVADDHSFQTYCRPLEIPERQLQVLRLR